MNENFNQLFWQTGAPEFYLLSHAREDENPQPLAQQQTQEPGGEEVWRNKPIS